MEVAGDNKQIRIWREILSKNCKCDDDDQRGERRTRVRRSGTNEKRRRGKRGPQRR